MSKRAFEVAFSCSTPGGLLLTANGPDSPQPQVQQLSNPSPVSSLHIPGQWPLESSLLAQRDTLSSASGGSFFSTVGKWAATVVNITNLLSLPHRLAQRFLRRQTIQVIPVVRADGSNKKRFIDAGLADEPATPSPSARARANLTRRRLQSTAIDTAITTATLSPDIWSPSPSPVQFCESPQLTASTGQNSDEHDIEYDEGLDFSFSDILTSTPPFKSADSPAQVVSISQPAPSPANPPTPTPPSRASKAVERALFGHETRGPYNHDPAPVTPMRRHLLKLQLRANAGFKAAQEKRIAEPVIAPATPTKPEDEEPSDLPLASSSPFQSDVSSPFQSDVSSPFQSDVSSPFQPNLSPDAPPVYENDLSFLSDAPSPRRKSVRWAQHAGTKSFFIDERVSEMLDSTLETITSSPIKPSWAYYDDNDDSSDGEGLNAALPTNSATENESHEQNGAPSVGFLGVPEDTFDCSDDSLEESQISLELLEDLQEDLKKKLSLAPPPPPPLKPLVEPLSTEEMDALESAAEKTGRGLHSTLYVVPEKLYARDFATLLPNVFNGDPRAWLNDNIVNEYLAILVKHKKDEAGFEHKRGGPAPPIHAFSSFWYTTAKTRPKSVERWASRFQLGGKQFLDAELILYPICDTGHWRLLAVKPKERIIEYFDSLNLGGEQYVETFQEYITKELGDAWVAEEWTVLKKQRSSQQLNGSDCGVFTLLNALTLLRGEEAHRVVPFDGMTDARERIAITLMAGRPTTEML